MFSSFRLPFNWARASQKAADRPIDVPLPKAHDIENVSTKEGRALKNLIKANHANYAIVDVQSGRLNPMAHLLGSAYISGANSEQMTGIYEKVGATLTAWGTSPGEISKHDWRDYLGKIEYQRAWLDFFEDQLVANGYDWKELLEQYLYDEQTPLFQVLGQGLVQPLLQLNYAYELSSQVLATEALAMAASLYDGTRVEMRDYLSSESSPSGPRSSEEITTTVRADRRLGANFEGSGTGWQPQQVLRMHESTMLEVCKTWDLSADPKMAFASALRTMALATVASETGRKGHKNYLLQALGSSHAVCNLLAVVPGDRQVALLRQWWLFSLLSYVAQGRPRVESTDVDSTDCNGRSWASLNDSAIDGSRSRDPDYIMALRALRNAADVWPDMENFFLKIASRLASVSSGWLEI